MLKRDIIKRHLNFLTWLIFLATACTRPDGIAPDIPGENSITSFFFGARGNDITRDLVGAIDHSKLTITVKSTEWLHRPFALIPSFEATGAVSVSGVEQLSGIDAADFFSTGGTIVYTVHGEDGKSTNYTVTVDSPVFSGLPVMKLDVDGDSEIIVKKMHTRVVQ